MELAEKTDRFGHHANAFGFLRLLFASLVIVSHVPEVVDVGSGRELLSRLTGTLSFGGFAVNGFFVISGYLITASWLNSRSTRHYLLKRAARLYPAFIVVSLVCLLIVAPLADAAFRHGPVRTAADGLFRMAVLARPSAEHPFPDQAYSDAPSGLNGATWTIQYEAACYLLVVVLGYFGALRSSWIVPALAVTLLAIGTFGWSFLPPWLSHDLLFPSSPSALFRLAGMFLAGASYYLARHRIGFRPLWIAGAAIAFAVCLLRQSTVNFGYAIFGGYLIFAAAKAGAGTWVGRINDRTDISYGLYLYAWPVERLLISWIGTDSLVLLGVLTWLIAAAAGWLSWTLIEKPALRRLTRRRFRSTTSIERQQVGAT